MPKFFEEFLVDVPGFEGRYAVNQLGEVWSHISQKFLRPGRKVSGHVSVALGRGNSHDVHELVLSTFRGPRPPKREARHLNGNPSDNRLCNLEWASRSRNTQDKKWHQGARNYKLTGPQAFDFKFRLAAGEPRKRLCAEYGVSKSTGDEIARGRFHRDA
jgi:hypothetical protein